MVAGVLALWLIVLFVVLAFPWFGDMADTSADKILPFIDDNLRHLLVLSLVHALGAMLVGGIVRLTVVSSRPMFWVAGSAILMALFALSQTLDFWFTQIGFIYQVSEIVLASCPPLFCILGGLLASKGMAHFSKNHAL